MNQNPRGSLEHFKLALEILEGGLKLWPNATAADRGVIFSNAFVNRVRSLELDALHSVRFTL